MAQHVFARGVFAPEVFDVGDGEVAVMDTPSVNEEYIWGGGDFFLLILMFLMILPMSRT